MTVSHAPSRWPHRLAVATFLAAIPLLLFGGTITTLEAGMVIDGWLVLEPGRGDHFLLFYPIDKWFRDDGTFAEHTHRLFGALVGMLSIATLVATWRAVRRTWVRWLAVASLAAVCLQGALGGFRVLENSPELAFLHGALAQIVFAILGVTAAVLSPRFLRARTVTDSESAALRASGVLALLLTYVTIFAGAWLRHSVSMAALGVHVLLVMLAIGALVMFAARLKRAGGMQRRQALVLHLLLGVQFLLGAASLWIVFFVIGNRAPEVHQSVFPTLHVMFGALLLAQVLAATVWSGRRLGQGVAAPEDPARAPLEAAS